MNSKEPEYWLNLGVAYSRLDRKEQALRSWHRVLELNPNDTRALYNIALTFMESNQPLNALELWHKILKINPKDDITLVRLGDYFWKFGEFSKADEFYSQILATKPDFPPALKHIGMKYFEMGFYQKGLELLEKLFGIDSEDCEVLVSLAENTQKEKDFPCALSYWVKLNDLQPKNLRTLYEIAKIKAHLNHDDVIEYIKQAITVNPEVIRQMHIDSEFTSIVKSEYYNSLVQLAKERDIFLNRTVYIDGKNVTKSKNRWRKSVDVLESVYEKLIKIGFKNVKLILDNNAYENLYVYGHKGTYLLDKGIILKPKKGRLMKYLIESAFKLNGLLLSNDNLETIEKCDVKLQNFILNNQINFEISHFGDVHFKFRNNDVAI